MTGNRATNLQNRVTRNKQAMVLAMLLILGVVSRSYAGWPFNRTPTIEGQVTDATTGEPIENVIVACGWQKRVPSFGGDITSSFAGEVSVTGKDGKYKIPAKTTFHLFSSFGGMMVQVLHPLYETKMEYGDNTGIMVDHIPMNKSKDGIVHADIRLMGLMEKVNQKDFNYGSFLQTYTIGFLNSNYDDAFVTEIFARWQEIAEEHFKGNGQVEYELDRLKKEFGKK